MEDPSSSPQPPPRPLVGRLAPSPTGVLHLGNVRSFLLAWLSIRSRGGTLLLRIEDIDGPRIRPEWIDRTIEDLQWLGLDWDGEPLLQSSRREAHEAAARHLLEGGEAYPCICTRREVEEAASAPHEPLAGGGPLLASDGLLYPGTCRGLHPDLEAARRASGREPALRFRVRDGAVPFTDLFLGEQPGLIAGDFVIRKRDGGAAYQLAVVVDDAAQGVTEVLRADDLLPSTPRQLLLHQALGLTPPAYAHVPLVVGVDGRRLAKRHGDTSVAHFRREGISAPRLIGWVASTCGLAPSDAEASPSDLLRDFDLARLPRDPVVGENPPLRDSL
ncbi:MAG: tRNA glutamyl-Q(34) synthetase GluQRS [Planctomycetota bacterium]